MKIKKGFVLRDICGEKIIVAEGIENIDFSKLISLNETGAFLWEAAGEGDIDTEALAQKLTEAYEVDAATALADTEAIVSQWKEAGIAE